MRLPPSKFQIILVYLVRLDHRPAVLFLYTAATWCRCQQKVPISFLFIERSMDHSVLLRSVQFMYMHNYCLFHSILFHSFVCCSVFFPPVQPVSCFNAVCFHSRALWPSSHRLCVSMSIQRSVQWYFKARTMSSSNQRDWKGVQEVLRSLLLELR